MASKSTSLLAVSERAVQAWTKDARKAEKDTLQAKAWDLWLECWSYRQIAEHLGVDDKSIAAWCAEKAQDCGNSARWIKRQPSARRWKAGGAVKIASNPRTYSRRVVQRSLIPTFPKAAPIVRRIAIGVCYDTDCMRMECRWCPTRYSFPCPKPLERLASKCR